VLTGVEHTVETGFHEELDVPTCHRLVAGRSGVGELEPHADPVAAETDPRVGIESAGGRLGLRDDLGRADGGLDHLGILRSLTDLRVRPG
jgi:hypothetical protein